MSHIPQQTRLSYEPDQRVLKVTTTIWIRWDADDKIVEVRQGYRIFVGDYPEYGNKINPFHDDYTDGYASGRATSPDIAINIMKREIDQLIGMLCQ
jgi:hypothetical protein